MSTAIERYLGEVDKALNVRGVSRRRFLKEIRDHLIDASAERGSGRAIRDFGRPQEIAAAFDAEIAIQRGTRSTVATTIGVLTTGGSTLFLINASSAGASAPTGWAIVFFLSAQFAAVAVTLALIQTFVAHRTQMTPADAALLARRNTCALAAAGIAMFSAGAALPGQGSAGFLLAGPALAAVAGILVLRARSFARKLDGSRTRAIRPPLNDLATFIPLPLTSVDAYRFYFFTICIAAVAAFVWDRGEQATIAQALVIAGVEAASIAGCFALLGRTLGLSHRAV